MIYTLTHCLLLDNAYLSIGQDYSASFKDLNINPGKTLRRNAGSKSSLYARI